MIGLRFAAFAALVALAGCASFSYTNTRLAQAPEPDPRRAAAAGTDAKAIVPVAVRAAQSEARASAVPNPRATFAVDGKRGNERVLFFLALSGGGSRAAYLSAATMLKLQTLFEDDLLQEVDVISAVSGGSLAAAYYAVTRDETLRLNGGLAPALSWPKSLPPGQKLQVDARSGTLRCTARLSGEETDWLHAHSKLAPQDAKRVAELCEQAQPAPRALRVWEEASVRDRMSRNYLVRWFLNWFWPHNLARYWFTAYDRSDIMAQTLEDNLFDTPLLGTPYEFKDTNPYRPYLIVNATNATGVGDEGELESYPFGTVFTFTDDDFSVRLRSEVRDYSVARAVMGSSAFPFVFPSMTLRDFRRRPQCPEDSWEPACVRYLHVFDGGNSDNLGLKSVKRALFEMALKDELKDYDKIVVLLVDAYTQPSGARNDAPDARSLLSRLVDTNFIHAVDSLLQSNRAKNVAEFHSAKLSWMHGECEPGTLSLPFYLCEALRKRMASDHLDLESKLVFYHFGFDDVRKADLKRALGGIPTSFSISREHAALIDQAVDSVLTPDNRCLRQMHDIVRGGNVTAPLARLACRAEDILPQAPAK